MTIIAGLFRYDGEALAERLCANLRRTISRNPADVPIEFRAPACCIVKVDIGAYAESAFERRGRASAAALAGDPLLPTTEGSARSRTSDLSRLHDAFLVSDLSPLGAAHGSFCAAHYADHPPRLTLVVDKLALRPLYCWHRAGLVAFASALRVLESIADLEKSLDSRGLSEQLAFSYPLADRTAYEQIRCLHAGEVVTFDAAGGERRERYWRWDTRADASLAPEEAPRLVHQAIERAVARRLKPGETSVAAFLSGGLDSRLIATTLKASVPDLLTFTFADDGTLDAGIGREYARKLGSRHHAFPATWGDGVPPSVPYGKLLASDGLQGGARPARPQLVWSGDGGSVGLGYVYINGTTVDLLRRGAERRAVDEFLTLNRRVFAARRILGDAFDQVPVDFLARAMQEELDLIRCHDPGSKIYIFLLLNDQRRHLFGHYEDIDEHRIELHLPFFDSEVLELMVRLPVEEGLYHKFYHDLLQCFPSVTSSVAWQVYPGHLPCPLAVPQGLRDQWHQTREKRGERIRLRLAAAQAVLADRNLPRSVLNKRQLSLALWTTRLGLRDRSYLLKDAATVYRHWRVCAAPPAPGPDLGPCEREDVAHERPVDQQHHRRVGEGARGR